MIIKNGKYVPYIRYKGSNFKIPKKFNINEINEKDCYEIINLKKKN